MNTCIKFSAALLIAFCASASPVSATQVQQPHQKGQKPYTLIISIDGFAYKAFQKWRQRAPNLNTLARRGVYGPSRTIFPSMTWPSHASIITGTYPRRHGILGNRIFNRTKKRAVHASLVNYASAFKVKTLIDLAYEKGMSTAAIMWPSTQRSKALNWNIPEVYGQKTYRRGSTPGFLKTLKELGFPSNHLGRFSKRQLFLQDSFVRDVAVHLVANKRPRLHLVHFLTMDSLGHGYGLNAPEVGWGLELVDRYVGDILKAYKRAGILGRTNVFIVSDHGFLTIEKRVDADRLLYDNGLIKSYKKLRKGPVYTLSNGHALYIYIYKWKELNKVRREVAALFRLPEVRPYIKKIIKPKSFKKYHLPHPQNNREAPDLIVVSKPHVIFGRLSGKRIVGKSTTRGMHGYFPSHEDLWPIFIAAGPNIRHIASPTQVENIDIAPTLAKVLGLVFPGPLDGKVRGQILRGTPTTPKP